MMNLKIEKPILSIDAKNSVCYTEFWTQKILIYEFYIQKARLPMNHENHPGHPYLYSFLLVFGLTLICALPAGSSYRSEREKQEAAEQRRIQELHNEFLTQKD